MILIHSREFDFYAIALPRGLGFGEMLPVTAWKGEDDQSCGILQRHAETGIYGCTIMRRRTDHVWSVTHTEVICVNKEEAMAVIRVALCQEKIPEQVPSGIILRPPLPRLKDRQPNGIFKLLAQPSHHAAFWAINQIYLALPKPDENWASDFQTGAFHTRLWELYLYASFKEQGRLVTQNVPSPDFLISNLKGEEAWIEAGTANPEMPYDHVTPAPTSAPTELQEKKMGPAAVRFAKSLGNKIQKNYHELNHVAGKPFAIAIADFHAPSSMMWSREAMIAYLYNAWLTAADHNDAIEAMLVEITEHLDENKFPAGLFQNSEYSWLSAVIFSNAATIAKFNRMGYLAGIRSKGLRMSRCGIIFDRSHSALKPINFDLDIASEEYAALWPGGGERWQ